MKIKNLLISTLLSTGVVSSSFLFINNNQNNHKENNISYEKKSSLKNPVVIENVKKSQLFYGIEMNVLIKQIPGYYISKVDFFYKNSIFPETVFATFNNNQNKQIKSYEGNINLLGFLNDENYLKNSMINYINNMNGFLIDFISPFSSNMGSSSVLIPSNEFLQYGIDVTYNSIDNSQFKNYSVSSPKFFSMLDHKEDFAFYDRSSISQIKWEYIDDESSDKYGWFKNEIIVKNDFLDKIDESSVSIYENGKKIDILDKNKVQIDFVYPYEEDNFNGYSYQFYLKPFTYFSNNFSIIGKFIYEQCPPIPYVLPVNFYYSWTPYLGWNSENLETKIVKLDKFDGVQSFKLIYSIVPKNEDIIDSIYIANDFNIAKPIKELNKNFNQFSFKIKLTNEKQLFNHLVLVAKVKDIYGNFHLVNNLIEPFEVDKLENISAEIEQIDSTSKTATFNYDINLGDQYKINKATFEPIDNPDYVDLNELKPIEFNFTNKTPLNGKFKILNLPSPSIIENDPNFKVVINYQTVFNHENVDYEIPEFSILRGENYSQQNIPEDNYNLDVNHNRAIINWKIDENSLGDDNIESVILKTNDETYESEINYSNDNMYLFGKFVINNLEYNKDYEYTLTYNIHTWIDGTQEGIMYNFDQSISFTSGNKVQIFKILILVLILLLLLFVILLLVGKKKKNSKEYIIE